MALGTTSRPQQKPIRTSFLEKATRAFLLIAILLVPIFFLPTTSDPFEMNKALLFGVLILLASLTFLLNSLLRREVMLVHSFVDYLVVVFLGLYVLSTIVSFNQFQSIVGLNGYYSDSLTAVLLFVLFFFLCLQTFRSSKNIFRALAALFISTSLLFIFNVLQAFKIYVLPWSLTHAPTFNLLANSTATLSVYLIIIAFLAFGLSFFVRRGWMRVAMQAGFALVVLFSLLLDKTLGWYGFIILSFTFLAFLAFRSDKTKSYLVILPTLFIALGIVFVFLDTSALLKTNYPDDILMSQSSSFSIVRQVVRNRPILGTGPETFNYNFEHYRSVDFNNSPVWSLRFMKASNQWMQYLGTIGIVPTLALLVLCFWYLVRTIRLLLQQKVPDQQWALAFLLFSCWATLFVLSFLYPFSFVLQFLFWMFLSLSLVAMNREATKETTYPFVQYPVTPLILSFLFLIILLVTAVFGYFGTRIWLASMSFVKAVQARDATSDLSIVQRYALRAVQLNPRQSDYHFLLAQAYATDARLQALKEKPDVTTVQSLTQNALSEINQGVAVDPRSPLVFENTASLYDSLRGLVSNAGDQVVLALAKALEREPNNPVVQLNIGRARHRNAQEILSQATLTDDQKKLAQDLLTQALADFEKAATLKRDFPDAQLQKALVYETQGELNKAIETMQALARGYPNNTDILYAFGQLYERNNKTAEATEVYLQIIALQPNHSNAHWQLGLLYEQAGEKDKALVEFKKVLELNPDNKDVKAKVDALQKQ